LALFITHHPFDVEALLQLSNVLYQTNSAHEGLSLLKRALYTFECASLNSFLQVEDRLGFMDNEHAKNEIFFSALFRLIRVSHIAGLPRTSLATSRFILSLDPLRDPKGVLLAIDHFALISNSISNDQWLVDLVESDKIRIHYKDNAAEDGYECGLLDLPNFAYSYALALFRLDRDQPTGDSKAKADAAMKQALSKFPSVLEQLMVKNGINTSGQSFQVDWTNVLHFARERAMQVQNTYTPEAEADPVVRSCTSQAFDSIVRIFVQQNFKLWHIDAVWHFAHKNLKDLQENPEVVVPIQPAIMRYVRCDPSDYEDTMQTMPADANPLDPGLVAQAMTIDTNRPRFMQRAGRGRGGMPDEFEMAMAGLNQQGVVLAGPPTEMIDPDWPVMEVFWRSFMPWAHVEGVPPPRR
jgi:Transcriptional repressor TCF25